MFDSASVISSSYAATERTSLLSKDIPSKFAKQWRQHLAALIASTIAMATGCVAGWSAPAIPYLQGNLGSLNITPITDNEASWVGSIVTLGALVGAIPAGKMAGLFGRKIFLLSLTFPMILGWFIILKGYESIPMLYLGRFICGAAFGAITVAVPMYNNEIAEDNIRGVMGVYFDMMWCIGILFAYSMGAYTSFFWLTLSCCLVPIIFFVTFIFMPESPVYLLVNDKKEAAATSLRWLRRGNGPSFDVTNEIAKIQQIINEANARAKTPSSAPKIRDLKSLRIAIRDVFGSTTTKAVIIGFGLMTFQRLSGVTAVVYYTVDIFRGAGTIIKPETATIIVGIVSVIASCVSAFFVDKLGRRFLLMLSGGAMALSLAVISAYFIIKDEGYSVVHLHLVPIVALSVFIAFFGIGLGPIPWFLIDEIMPEEAKSWGNSLIICQNWLTAFVVAKSFPPLTEKLGFAVTFCILTYSCTMGGFFCYYFVPETKNRSFIEINREVSFLFVSKDVRLYENREKDLIK